MFLTRITSDRGHITLRARAKNHEISNYVTDKIVHHEYKKPMIMPFWYYTNIITRRYKRFRPEKSQYKDISKNDV